MKRILVLYFSGGGATRYVAGLMAEELRQFAEVDLYSVEDADRFSLGDYDGFAVGSPVYHAAPARLLMEYFAGQPPLKTEKPAFLFNTRGMFSCNTNRILANEVRKCKLITVMERDYRSPASDGSLIVPFVKRFFEFESGLEKKIREDCRTFSEAIDSMQGNMPVQYGQLPRFRFSSVVNSPNKLAGQLITFRIHLHADQCTKCSLCIRECPHQSMTSGADGHPQWDKNSCENCYRCIHQCPGHALSLSKKRAPKKLLRY